MQGQPDGRGSRPPMPPAATTSTFNRAATEQLCQVQRMGAHLFISVIILHQSSCYINHQQQCQLRASIPINHQQILQ